jgi:RNA polymerase sigma factor for flagellar operon FliA
METGATDKPARTKRSYRRPETAALWERYRSSAEPVVRLALAEAYDPFARMLASKVFAQRAFSGLEHGEYVQTARVALLESIDRFDATRGAMFETFATPRITGALLDALERSSDVQGQIAARRRVMASRVAALAAGRSPDDDVFSRLAEIAVGLAVGLMLEDTGLHQDDSASLAEGYKGVELRQLQLRLGAAVERLPERQRQVIAGHYLQHCTFDEIAADLGLSKGRISQIHKEALEQLRRQLCATGSMDLRC